MPDGRYFMTYVAQENPGGIKYMISDKINAFNDYHAEQIDAENGACEAPNTWKRIGENKWVVMYDIFSINPHNFGFVETTDFKTFKPLGRFNEGVMKATNFVSPKHGSVIQITKEEAERLENYWKKQSAEMPTVTQTVFADTDGAHINAHGGAITKDPVSGVYYWYGEHRGSKVDKTPQLGVSCYSSTDLKNWTNRGIVLALDGEEGTPLEAGCTIERPKVVYCPNTGKWVMWFHHELKGRGYWAAYAGVAQADSPVGPFKFIGTGRVNPGYYPMDLAPAKRLSTFEKEMEWWTPEWYEAVSNGMFTLRDLIGGQMARDMTVFVDTDGKAYHIYASEENLTLQVAELDSTYTHHTGRFIRINPGGHNEAPAIFKHNGTYWMITSGCTGWAPNEARLMRADNIWGPWERLPNPCRGEGQEITFGGQSTAVFVENGKYTFMADIWKPDDLRNSQHLWLPIKFDANETPYVEK